MKAFVIATVLLVADFTAGTPLAFVSRPGQDSQALGTCEEATTEVARFKDAFSEWGSGQGGDAWRSTKNTSAAGESYWEGHNFYKSRARFKKAIRQITENVEGIIARTPLFDEQGHQIGQRVVRETRFDGKVTSVHIQLITDRMIRGINAPSLMLALTVEKATITCRAEIERHAN